MDAETEKDLTVSALIPSRHRQVDAALSSVICVICPVTGVAAPLDTTILFKTVQAVHQMFTKTQHLKYLNTHTRPRHHMA